MNKQLDLLLIRLVKATPILYDKSKFSDYNEREVAWQKIGDKLHRPALDCKERWMSMRELFRCTTLKMSRAKTNGRHIRKKPYKYHNELMFLLAHYKHSKNDIENLEDKVDGNDSSNVANDDDDDDVPVTFDIDGPDIPDMLNDVDDLNDDNGSDNIHDDVLNGVDELKDDEDSDNAEIINFSEDSTREIDDDIKSIVSKPKSNPKVRQRKKAVNNTKKKSMQANNKMIELNPSNATDKFLIDIRAKLQRLSRSKVDKVKSKIYSIVSQYE